MKDLLIFTFAAAALASPVPEPKEVSSTDDFHVTLQVMKDTNEVSISAWNRDRTELVGHSCSKVLDTGAFQSHPISFDVDMNGAGNVTIGGRPYLVNGDPEVSGGISCGRIHSKVEALVNCAITLPSSLKLHSLNRRQVEECFPGSNPDLDNIRAGLENNATAPATQVNSTEIANAMTAPELEGRQFCQAHSYHTSIVGDGNPHQNPMNVQLSDNFACGGRDTCTIGYGEARSWTVGFSASATAWQWLSGGFSVEMSVETGNSYECQTTGDDFFCMWKKVGQTAYTVQNWVSTCAGRQDSGSPYVMWSPNSRNINGYYYCVHGRQYCRTNGERWLEDYGPAGGV